MRQSSNSLFSVPSLLLKRACFKGQGAFFLLLFTCSTTIAQVVTDSRLIRLYEISVFTSEDAVANRLVEAEVELLAARFLLEQLEFRPISSQGSGRQLVWERELGKLKSAVMPLARKAYAERARILTTNNLVGGVAFVQAYVELLGSTSPSGSRVKLDDGTTVGQGGYEIGHLQAIFDFHNNPATGKWRSLWPDLRVYAAQMLALQYRLQVDEALYKALEKEKRSARTPQNLRGGRVMTQGEWIRVTEGRLGYTLSGMSRFPLLLGSKLQRESERTNETTIIRQKSTGAVVVSELSAVPLRFNYLDGRWGRDFAQRLSTEELAYIDFGLTASYDEIKRTWFAPLGLEWDAYVAVQTKINQHNEMQELFRTFSNSAKTTMKGVWANAKW